MKETCKNQIDCELNCKATASLNASIIDDLLKEDACLLDMLKDSEDNEPKDPPKPID